VVNVQDDTREEEIRTLAGLEKIGGRTDVDAHLTDYPEYGNIPFELKSSTGKSVSTGRDVGHDHLTKWDSIDWLVGFYIEVNNELSLSELYHFGPGDLDWFKEKISYIEADYVLLDLISQSVDDSFVTRIFGDDDEFDVKIVKKFLKQQKMYPSGERLKVGMIQEMADLPSGIFSRSAMVQVVKERAKYLVHRGGTLNNPHIPKSKIEEVGNKLDISNPDRVQSQLRSLILRRLRNDSH